jgi:prepilin-type N-terminal cleavage/methylation domain-containing protein
MRIPSQSAQRKSRQAGFSFIEVMISMIVVTVGLVGMLSVFAFATASTQSAQQDMIAKQLASEAMESIFTARETAQVTWGQIQNTGTGQTPDGIFVTGFQDIHQSGANGIYGTSDDADSPARTLTLVGRDGIPGTADDRELPLTNYKRKIEITSVSGTTSLRLVTITIKYTVSPKLAPKNYVVTAYISQFR